VTIFCSFILIGPAVNRRIFLNHKPAARSPQADNFALMAPLQHAKVFERQSIMKVISTVELKPAHRAAISSAVAGVEIVDRQCRTEGEVNELVGGGGDVMVTFRVPDDVAERAPSLRWIQLLSAGADHVLNGPHKLGTIEVTTTSGIHATPIAEYTLASMLAYAHRFHLMIRAQTKHEWLKSGRFMATVDEIRGQTLGIIGYGSIGRETARLAQAFGMKVLALKRDPKVRSDPGWCPAGLGDPAGTIPERFFFFF
jgi:phosphoglycerate dehydrogenase-like enzyme